MQNALLVTNTPSNPVIQLRVSWLRKYPSLSLYSCLWSICWLMRLLVLMLSSRYSRGCLSSSMCELMLLPIVDQEDQRGGKHDNH